MLFLLINYSLQILVKQKNFQIYFSATPALTIHSYAFNLSIGTVKKVALNTVSITENTGETFTASLRPYLG